MRFLASLLLCLRLVAPAGADPIDDLVARLSTTHGLWVNGLFADLGLPQTAAPSEVIACLFTKVSFDQGRVTEHRLLSSREVELDGGRYLACLVETNLGRKIVLMQWQRTMWWTRVY